MQKTLRPTDIIYLNVLDLKGFKLPQTDSEAALHHEQLKCWIKSDSTNESVFCAGVALSSSSEKKVAGHICTVTDMFFTYCIHVCFWRNATNGIKENHKYLLMDLKLLEREALGMG